MSSRTLRRRMLGAGVLAASVVALTLVPVPVTASATSTGKCIWYDFDVQPTTPGAPRAPLEDCALHPDWPAEASYYWDEQRTKIVEPWKFASEQFDYSAFSQLNPFTGDGYSFRKANELFPDTSRVAEAAAKLRYAEDSLRAKARAIDSRHGLTSVDGCNYVPALASDLDIRNEGGWLPPTPTADGRTGSITYTMSPNLTGEQRSSLLAGLELYKAASAASRQPQLVEWTSGSAEPPVITFAQDDGSIDDPDATAITRIETGALGRDGLPKWVNGSVLFTQIPDRITPIVVVHEILHVLGFDHISFSSQLGTMSPDTSSAEMVNGWYLSSEPTPSNYKEVDSCTKEGIQNAPAPE